MTLNLHLCIPFLFATHLLMMDNNVTNYHQYPSRHSKVTDRTRFAQTDRRTDGQTDGRTDKVIPIYPLNFVRRGCGGGGGNGTSSLTKFVTLNLHLCIPLLFGDTPSHDGQQCYQVSSISIEAFKSYGPNTICTDRRTEGQTK